MSVHMCRGVCDVWVCVVCGYVGVCGVWVCGVGVGMGVCASALVLTFSPSNLHCSKCSASCSRVPSNVQLKKNGDTCQHYYHMPLM